MYMKFKLQEWKEIVFEKMRALEKNKTLDIIELQKESDQLGARECSPSNVKQMVHWKE